MSRLRDRIIDDVVPTLAPTKNSSGFVTGLITGMVVMGTLSTLTIYVGGLKQENTMLRTMANKTESTRPASMTVSEKQTQPEQTIKASPVVSDKFLTLPPPFESINGQGEDKGIRI